jgi:hypothetical protein
MKRRLFVSLLPLFGLVGSLFGSTTKPKVEVKWGEPPILPSPENPKCLPVLGEQNDLDLFFGDQPFLPEIDNYGRIWHRRNIQVWLPIDFVYYDHFDYYGEVTLSEYHSDTTPNCRWCHVLSGDESTKRPHAKQISFSPSKTFVVGPIRGGSCAPSTQVASS